MRRSMPSSPTKERARDPRAAIAALLAAPGSRRSRRSARSSTAMRRSRLGARRALSRSPRPKEHAARWVMMMMIQSGAAPTPKRLLEQHISTEVSSQLRFLSRKWMLGGTWCARCAVPGVVACHQPPPAMVRILVHCCGRLFRPFPPARTAALTIKYPKELLGRRPVLSRWAHTFPLNDP